MNVAEVKQVLSRCWWLEARIKSERNALMQLRSVASKATPSYSLTSGGGGDGQKIENCVLRIVELETKNKETLVALVEAKEAALEIIETLPDARLQSLLRKRYLSYKKWEEIAVELKCSYRRVHQLHSKALVFLAKNF